MLVVVTNGQWDIRTDENRTRTIRLRSDSCTLDVVIVSKPLVYCGVTLQQLSTRVLVE